MARVKSIHSLSLTHRWTIILEHTLLSIYNKLNQYLPYLSASLRTNSWCWNTCLSSILL